MNGIRFKLGASLVFLLLAGTPAHAADAASPSNGAGINEHIVAIVNKDAITASELAAREKLLIASAGLPDTPDVQQKLRVETLDTLIEEKIMMQAGEKEKVTISKDEIAGGFATIAKQNNLTADQFRDMMTQTGIPPVTLENEVEAQLNWGQVVQKHVRPQVDVTDSEVDDALTRAQGDLGKTQYLLAEIFLPVSSPQEEANVHQLALRLEAEIRQGHTPFQRVANQFSAAPGAAKGGSLGWVPDGQLDPAIAHVVATMNENDLSPPVRTADGYHIVLLRKKQTATAKDLPSRDDLRQKIGIDKLERAQRAFMQELRSQAFIERRT